MRLFASLCLGLLTLNSPSNACCFCPEEDSSEDVKSRAQMRSSPNKEIKSDKEEVVLLGNGMEEGFFLANIDKNGNVYYPDPPDIMTLLGAKSW